MLRKDLARQLARLTIGLSLRTSMLRKLNADDYTTAMTGLKFKLAHKRSTKNTWNVSDEKQRKELIKILKGFIKELEDEPEKAVPVPLHFDYNGKKYEGVGFPMMSGLP